LITRAAQQRGSIPGVAAEASEKLHDQANGKRIMTAPK